MFGKHLYFWLFLFGFGTLYGQTHIKLHYTQRNGLPQNSVIDLFRDSTQYLWLTTEDGLIRFDGHKFHISNISNTPFIRNDRFRWILPNIDGKIVAASTDGGLVEIRKNKIYPYLEENHQYQRLLGILPNDNDLLKILNAGPEFFQRQNDIRNFPIQLVSQNKQIYALGWNAIYRLSGTTKTDTIPLNGKFIAAIFNIQNQIYARSLDQLYWVDTKHKKLHPITLNPPLKIDEETRTYYQDISKNTCIVSNNKVYILKPKDGDPTHIQSSFQLDIMNEIEGPISNISVDEESGVIAIGSLTNGLYLFKPKLFETTTYISPTEPINGSYAITAINDSTILTANGVKVSPRTIFRSNYNMRHINNMLLHYDRRGRVWSCRGDSLFYQTEDKPRVLCLTDSSHFIHCWGSYGDSLLVMSDAHITALYDGKVIYKAKMEFNGAPYHPKYGVYLYPYKNKWYASIENTGLCEIQLGKTAVVNKLADYKQVRFITVIDDILFGGSYGNGWFAYSDNKLTKLPLDPAHYLSKAHTIMKDSTGKIYITTNRGLFSTTITQVKDYISEKQTGIYYQYYDDNEGIENTEFNGGCNPSGVLLKNGYMIFPNIQGIVWFNPYRKSINTSRIPQTLNLDYIETDGKLVVDHNDSLIIESGVEKISLGFSTVYWNNPNNIKLEYKLTGFHSNWVSLNIDAPVVVITNLPHGEYDLLVRAQVGFNSNEIETFKLHVIKKPKYYETWGFVLLLSSAVFLVILGINFLYNRQLRNQNTLLERKVGERTFELELTNKLLLKSESELLQSVNVKNKLISIISHDIVTPLKFISLASKNYRSAESKSPDNEFIREIHHTSQRLFDNAQNILNWVRYQNNLIRVNKTTLAPFALADEIAELFKELASMRKNTIINDVDMDDVIVSDKTILIIILQNIISNAVKYTHSSCIRISSEHVSNGRYNLIVSDDGHGISPNNMKRIEAIRNRAQANTFEDSADGTGLGYIIIFELAELIDATVTIETEANKGTRVCISLT